MSATGARKTSEIWFEKYLNELGYGYEFEPPLDGSHKPDYKVWSGAGTAICEVSQFARTKADARLENVGSGFMSLSDEEVYTPFRSKLKEESKQLREYKDLGLPLVVVVANPKGCFVDLSPQMVCHYMYGTPRAQHAVSAQGPVGDTIWTVARDGRLLWHHTYISAVIVLHQGSHESDWYEARLSEMPIEKKSSTVAQSFAELDRLAATHEVPTGHYYFAHVFHNDIHEGGSVPVPAGMFEGPKDEHFRALGDGSYGHPDG